MGRTTVDSKQEIEDIYQPNPATSVPFLCTTDDLHSSAHGVSFDREPFLFPLAVIAYGENG